MSEAEHTTTSNTAEYGATVGIQAEQVHNSVVHMELPDFSPREKYELGVRFLEDGVPARARELITEAIAHGCEDGEVRFRWVMAMLSKRAYRDLSVQERDQLSMISDFLSRYAEDEWKRALTVVHELLECLRGVGGDPGPAVVSIRFLEPRQRAEIVRHLDLVLTGGAKDSLWAEVRDKAYAAQDGGDRVKRVWAYFEPNPAEARACRPVPVSTSLSDWSAVVLSATALVASAVFLGWATWASRLPVAIAAYVAVIGAGAVGFRSALEWHYRSDRLRAIDQRHEARPGDRPERGFSTEVEYALKYYFGKYLPEKRDRKMWLAATAGIRATMRDEIVALYDDDDFGIGNVRWLLRYMARDVRRRYQEKTLRSYRREWRTRSVIKLVCAGSLSLFAAALVGVAVLGVHQQPVIGAINVFVLFVGIRAAVGSWSRLARERWRFADQQREYEQLLAARRAEHQRWSDKLDSLRPDETEMEAWLSYDKTVMLDKALRHYKLAWRDVIAHAFLQTPANRYKRARMDGCPWRYSRYDMRLFLVTHDGVREYRCEFDFENVVIAQSERNNFRFDAVSSVGVIATNGLTYTLKLTLTNGPSNNIRIMDPTREQDTEVRRKAFSEINLDAAGFTPTLHVLEGIAAEGKSWIERDPQLRGPVVSSLSDDL